VKKVMVRKLPNPISDRPGITCINSVQLSSQARTKTIIILLAIKQTSFAHTQKATSSH